VIVDYWAPQRGSCRIIAPAIAEHNADNDRDPDRPAQVVPLDSERDRLPG